jgi:hypothetical protein
VSEFTKVQGRRLGRVARVERRALSFDSLLTGVVPEHPKLANNFTNVADFDMYGNDEFGVCGPAAVANQRKQVTKYLGDSEKSPGLSDVFDLYRRSGNPNFDPSTDADDNGVEMQTMCDALMAEGIAGVKPVAFGQISPSNFEAIRAAIAVFGSVLWGVDLKIAQQRQTDQGLWDYRNSAEWGGHCVLGGGYTSVASRDFKIETWAELVDVTDSFVTHQLEEVWVLVWPEHLKTKEFQEGVDVAALASSFKQLTGKDLPVPTPPPVTPPSSDADTVLAQAMHAWLSEKGL